MKAGPSSLFAYVMVLVALMSTVSSAYSTVRSCALRHRPVVPGSPVSFHLPVSHTCKTFQHSMTSSSDEETSTSTRIQSPLDRPLLAALDFMAILLFAFVGTTSHNSASDYLAVVAVAVPFLISWFVTTPFLGLFNEDATSSVKGALATAAKGWIAAIPLGCVLRGIIKGYVPPLPFVIVTMIATLVVIGGTRVIYTIINEKASHRS